MGAKHSDVKERVLGERNLRLENDMRKVKESMDDLGLTAEGCAKIGGMTVHEIVDSLNSATLTSKQLVVALCFRAGTFGFEMGFVTETNFIEALRLAEQCDQKRKESKKKNWTFSSNQQFNDQFLPPLFGIPISVKDTYDMKGFLNTMGCLSKTNVQEHDSPIVTCFRGAGMIPFVRSTCPQIAMTYETVTNIWGRARNPWNPERSVGGSSGGEGGLIAGRCSLLGVGSDIGGSIRIPAELCGVFGLKPSSQRISGKYHGKLSESMVSFSKNVPLCLGPLGHSAEDLALFMKTVTDEKNYQGTEDFYTKIFRFDDDIYNKEKKSVRKCKIGFVKSLQCLEPTQASSRALQIVIDELKAEGHEIVQVQIPNQQQIVHSFFKEVFSVDGKNYLQILDGEKPIDEYRSLFRSAGLIQPFRGLLAILAKQFMPRLYSYCVKDVGRMSTFNYQTHMGIMNSYREDWMKYWKSQQFDFIVAPGFGCQAIKHGGSEHASLPAAYTFVWNILDMTVGSMPITVVKQTEQIYETRYRDLTTRTLIESAKDSVGLPVGVQFVGAPYEEERVLGLMHRIEKKIKFYEKHPLPNRQ